MSNTENKFFCFLDADTADTQEKNSETNANEKEEMQEDKRNLQCNLVKEICPVDLRYWPIFSLLEPDFILQIHMVMVYCLGNKAIIVAKDKNVYSLGYNLMDDNLKIDEMSQPRCLEKIQELCGKNIKTLTHATYHVLALTEEGELYSWKFIKRKRDNEQSLVSVTPTPTRVIGLSDKRIVDIASICCRSFALTSDGKVYTWEENIYGQVGNESTSSLNRYLPRQVKHVLENKNVVQIACGISFEMFLTDEGKLYGWDDNEDGQISIVGFKDAAFGSQNTTSSNIQSQKHYKYPHEVTTISVKIIKVACGWRHTLILTNKGKVYAVGNMWEQYGVKKFKPSGPIMVNMPVMVVDIAAYGDSSVAVGSNRIIYVWGNCFSQYITTPFPTTFSKIHDAFAFARYRVMHKPLILSTNDYKYIKEELEILESLGAVFDDPSTSNFTVQVKGQSIHVHKNVLKIRSQYFRDKFQRDSTENDQNIADSSATYTVSDQYSYIVYKAFLKYLYTGTLDVPLENALELMELADEYGELSLKKSCGQIIKQAITKSNVAFFYNKAIECNAKELEEFCFQFALRHLTAEVLSAEYSKLDFSLIDYFMRKAAKKNAFKT